MFGSSLPDIAKNGFLGTIVSTTGINGFEVLLVCCAPRQSWSRLWRSAPATRPRLRDRSLARLDRVGEGDTDDD